MRLLKNTLFFTSFLFIHQATAKPMQSRGVKANAAPAAARPVRAQVPARIAPSTPAAPIVVQGSFQDLMQQVRNMQANVINDQGLFTDTFKNFVQSSGLAPELMITLMETGRNLHLPLSGDNKKDISLILFTNQNIDDFVRNLAVVSAPIIPIAVPQAPKQAPVIQPVQRGENPRTPALAPGIPKTNPVIGKPIMPQAPTIPVAYPRAPRQKPIIQPVQNKPADPLEYAELIKNQFGDELKIYFTETKPNIFTFGKNSDKFPAFARDMMTIMFTEYPQITPEDMLGAVKTIVLMNDSLPSHIDNSPHLTTFIQQVVMSNYDIVKQEIEIQPQNQPSPIQAPGDQQFINTVVESLVKIDQQNSIESLFTEHRPHVWHIRMPHPGDTLKINLAYGDSLLLIDKLAKILRDTYPNSLKSQLSLNTVIDAIIDGMTIFLNQKYNKKFEDSDFVIPDYLTPNNRF